MLIKKQKIKRKIFCDYLRALNMLEYGCHRDQHFEETPKCLKTRMSLFLNQKIDILLSI